MARKKLKKGSKEAKLFMARLRSMRTGSKKKTKRRTVKRKPKPKTRKRRKISVAKKKSYRRRRKKKLTITKALMGGFGVVIADQLADQMLAKFNIGVSDDIVKFGIGMYASTRSGMIGEAGKALAYVNASRLLSNINIGNILGNATSGTNGTNGDGWN